MRKPTRVSKEDVLRMQLCAQNLVNVAERAKRWSLEKEKAVSQQHAAEIEIQKAQVDAKQVQKQIEDATKEIKQKYGMGPKDVFDESGLIQRKT